MPDGYDSLLPEDLTCIDIKVNIQSVSILLTKTQGEMIKDIIRENYVHPWPYYCKKVGVSPPNFYNNLNGERPCTIEWLNKLLSGIGYQVALFSPVIVIQEIPTGVIVPNVDSIKPEEELQSNVSGEKDEYD